MIVPFRVAAYGKAYRTRGAEVASMLDPATLSDEELLACLREAGRRYAARRLRHDTACVVCGAALANVTTRRQCCSARCRAIKAEWQGQERRRSGRRGRDPLVVLEERYRRMGWLPDVDGGGS